MSLHTSVRAQFVIAPLLVVFGQYLLLARLFVWRESPARCRVGAGMAGDAAVAASGYQAALLGSVAAATRVHAEVVLG